MVMSKMEIKKLRFQNRKKISFSQKIQLTANQKF